MWSEAYPVRCALRYRVLRSVSLRVLWVSCIHFLVRTLPSLFHVSESSLSPCDKSSVCMCCACVNFIGECLLGEDKSHEHRGLQGQALHIFIWICGATATVTESIQFKTPTVLAAPPPPPDGENRAWLKHWGRTAATLHNFIFIQLAFKRIFKYIYPQTQETFLDSFFF